MSIEDDQLKEWKTDFSKLFIDRFPDLYMIKKKKLLNILTVKIKT